MTATIPAHADVRDCKLYRFRCWHPDDMGLPVGQRRILARAYIGETGRESFARLLEHVRDQPWGDTMAGWDVIGEYVGKAAVLEAERLAIIRERPTYNVEHNKGNPDRIPPPLAIRQRRARDAARAAPRWVHPDDRAGGAVAAPRVKPRPKRRRCKPWQRTLLAWTIAWLVLAVAGWIAFTVLHWGGWKQTGIAAAVVTSMLLGWLRWSKPGRKIRRFFR